MNRHFEDAWYYLRRAGNHLADGLREEAKPVERRIRSALGREREEESEPTGRERLESELRDVPRRAERGGKKAIKKARGRIKRYRGGASE
ncbi:hypothetical protein C499_01665 [Halogeometricum borinquense DSM 11551]|uniref:Uncharacterized protein n=2 Tax=Halogeometricum borinquense TaxID=60847 RepID=E4NNZ2_HALBP|nr:hypothetical protein [Halogeometricum borinquense]ADQ66423.1 hypothetical protein Hbor_08270 [Halogeometricum borinquense DSM 11551]ELY31143.1 hypothetical protein C499_01665 [Halogeometricum borinquense DSM 11551]RYJ15178.1 hypothetical protein ELS19_15315 [Halogeometricum borinquense]